jgi:hypothetical protein
MCCCDGNGYCGRCRGCGKILIGVLMLVNFFFWPRWTGVDGWLVFFAVILVLGGLWKALMPTCCCNASKEKPAPKKKR